MTPGPAADFHSHLMPGVDDGAAHVDEARAGVEAMARDGVTSLITTPHFEGSLTRQPEQCAERLAALDTAFAALTADAGVVATGVRIMRGVELLLDIPDPDLSDERVRLNGSRFVLVEYPALQIPPMHADFAIRTLRDQGWQPVLAHPERYRNADDDLATLGALRMAGAYFQGNAGSFVGQHGETARRRAFQLLGRGWLDFGSSDFHSRGAPAVAAARAQLAANGATEQAELLFAENPARLMRGDAPLPVAPARSAPKPWWRTLLGGGS